MSYHRTLQRSFAGGEMSPQMLARVDDTKFQNGYAPGTANFQVLSNGALARSPGLRHVALAKHADKRCRLITFQHSIDQTMQVELGDLYLRLHQNGSPFRYATPFDVASIDVSNPNNTITFTQRHGLTSNTQVRVTADSGSNAHLPSPLSPTTVYYVIVVDAKTIKLSATPGPGAAEDLTTVGTGQIRVWRQSEYPPTWATFDFTFGTTDVNRTTNTLNLAGHSFVDGQAVRFVSSITLPAPLVSTRNYFVRAVVAAVSLRLAERPEWVANGPDVDLISIGNGTHTIRPAFNQGELRFYDSGTTHGIYYALAESSTQVPGAAPTFWRLMRADGVYELVTPYLEADLREITHDQDNDVVTLAHRSYPVAELRRHSLTRWTYTTVLFSAALPPPSVAVAIARTGDSILFTFPIDAARTKFTMSNAALAAHGYVVGDTLLVEGTSAGSGLPFGGNAAGPYVVSLTGNNSGASLPHNDLYLRSPNGGYPITTASTVGSPCAMRYVSLSSQSTSKYRITSVTAEGSESDPSVVVQVDNNDLSVSGSFNELYWETVAGASAFNVYKEQAGLYGFLARVELSGTKAYTGTVSALIGSVMMFYSDDNSLIPDLARTLPIRDTTLTGTDNNPAAVTHFEQRRFFGGTNREPQSVWGTRSGTESELAFHLPLVDDDRLQFELKSREAVSVRHLVPIEQLLVLTNSTEFRILPVNSEVLTPSSIDAKAHDYTGASIVQPSVLGGNVVFCGARGGHVYEIGFRPDGAGLAKPGDLCLRSSHLFDNRTIVDQIAVKSPHPNILFVSSAGSLLGITYIPQEQVGAWHARTTAGVIESVSAAPEGDEDRVYLVVKRTIDGEVVRSIERMAAQQFVSLRECYFADDGGTFDGRNTGATTMTVTGGSFWTAGESVTVTSSTVQFVLGSEDVGDEIALWTDPEGTVYRIRITVVLSGTAVTGTLRATLPAALHSGPVTSWGFARDTISLPWLDGEEVEILADGLELDPATVSGGQIVLSSPALVAQVGLSALATLNTLPLAMQVEALGQGRPKNVSRTFIKVLDSGAFEIGPSGLAQNMVPANLAATPGTVRTEEVDTTIMPSYSQGGAITIRSNPMLPLTVLGWVLQFEAGGDETR